MLAYIFWHRPHPQIEERTYDADAVAALHSSNAAADRKAACFLIGFSPCINNYRPRRENSSES
ncbi:MAG: hypothetical protein WA728_10685, partial [Xanthobacteraceae bacterium]